MNGTLLEVERISEKSEIHILRVEGREKEILDCQNLNNHPSCQAENPDELSFSAGVIIAIALAMGVLADSNQADQNLGSVIGIDQGCHHDRRPQRSPNRQRTDGRSDVELLNNQNRA
ncbi:hypothetical protein PGTUg99_008548 [Puccinia graminis f. sp. tritici]|uniref:Uncharacterized protein n=1 Tax=Puccinia graminis f. sp. tritici TaxID=56615 RepID=A0A5B0RZ42_PUCGR|nr:hypothetical protein PGTUg99_008548 [Puccinia graminis f. sp. tritici]